MLINKYEAIEFDKRGVLHMEEFGFENNTMTIKSRLDLRKPTLFDTVLAYLTGVIPAAMLARVVRKVTGQKGTPLENALMRFYYDGSVVLLRKKCK